MRIAAVADIHAEQNFAPFRRDLEALGEVDLFLLGGDVTEHNDIDAFGRVLREVRSRVRAPTYAIFGNNEYSQDHAKYRAAFDVSFLDDEAVDLDIARRRIRLIGSTGCLDRPTWWQRTNLPGIWREYEERGRALERLLADGSFRVLLTHYPPTYATMGGEKEEWRPELGCRRLEPMLLRHMPDLVIHGHVHKGIPFAELRREQRGLEDFAAARTTIPIYNVAYPVTNRITVLDV